jgi:hypothetical protein
LEISQEPTICSHLLDSGDLDRPFSLVATPAGPEYSCPSCAADHLEAHQARAAVGGRLALSSFISFDRCQHPTTRAACLPCLSAVKAELRTRWAATAFSDKTKRRSNRLHRLENYVSKAFDLASKTPAQKKPDPSQLGKSDRRFNRVPFEREQSARGDRARATLAHLDRRAEHQAAAPLRKPLQVFSVIRPSQSTA